MAKNIPHVVTFDELEYNVYKGESASQDRLRSIIKEIRAKVPNIQITTVRGTGYGLE